MKPVKEIINVTNVNCTKLLISIFTKKKTLQSQHEEKLF